MEADRRRLGWTVRGSRPQGVWDRDTHAGFERSAAKATSLATTGHQQLGKESLCAHSRSILAALRSIAQHADRQGA